MYAGLHHMHACIHVCSVLTSHTEVCMYACMHVQVEIQVQIQTQVQVQVLLNEPVTDACMQCYIMYTTHPNKLCLHSCSHAYEQKHT
jgi:hypothetical protein